MAGGHGHISDSGAACDAAAPESKVVSAVLSCLKVWPKSWQSPDSRSCACQAELLESSIPGQHSPSFGSGPKWWHSTWGFTRLSCLCLLQGLLRETGAVCGAAEDNASVLYNQSLGALVTWKSAELKPPSSITCVGLQVLLLPLSRCQEGKAA